MTMYQTAKTIHRGDGYTFQILRIRRLPWYKKLLAPYSTSKYEITIKLQLNNRVVEEKYRSEFLYQSTWEDILKMLKINIEIRHEKEFPDKILEACQ